MFIMNNNYKYNKKKGYYECTYLVWCRRNYANYLFILQLMM